MVTAKLPRSRQLERREVARLSRSLRAFRKRNGYGVREAARACGVSPATLNRVERGGIPSLGVYLCIADYIYLDSLGKI